MKQLLNRFYSDDEGSAIILVSITLMVMLLAAGAAIDISRMHTSRVRLTSCLDEAGLAGLAQVSQIQGDPTKQVYQSAENYYLTNCPSGFDTTGAVSFTNNASQSDEGNSKHNIVNLKLSSDHSTITMSASLQQPTDFMYIFGIRSLTVTAQSVVQRNNNTGIELALVLDNTGSMADPVDASQPHTVANSKMVALKAAATQLINTLFNNNTTAPPNVWVGIVPFSQTVNIGTANSNWIGPPAGESVTYSAEDFGPTDGTSPMCLNNNGVASSTAPPPSCTYNMQNTAPGKANIPNFNTRYWAGCVMARGTWGNSGGNLSDDINDHTPTQAPFQPYWYPPTTQLSLSGLTTNFSYRDYNGNIQPVFSIPDHYPAAQYPNLYSSTATLKALNNFWVNSVINGNTTTTTYMAPLNAGPNNGVNDYTGPNAYCPSPIVPMTQDKATLVAGLNQMVPAGQTLLDIGVAWGGRLLSPNWRGVWPGSMAANNLPIDYNKKGNLKVLVLMTDGYNFFFPGSYTAYGQLSDGTLWDTSQGGAQWVLHNETEQVCAYYKKQGVYIYTIGFGMTDNITSIAPNGATPDVNGEELQNCASAPGDYFLASSDAQLMTAFQTIANNLLNIRVSQ